MIRHSSVTSHLSCRLHDGIRPCPSAQTPSCDGVTYKAAFSLIELAIVLVILGLLVGGIMTGQSLIRAAELRSVTTQQQNYQTAVVTFRDKYFYLPGDMTNATAFWGAAHATPATCRTTASNSSATCNGNGDGQIFTADGLITMSEMYHVWKQLSNSGLIEGQYTGVTGGPSTLYNVPGVNVPKGKLGSSGCFSFSRYSNSFLIGQSSLFNGNYSNSMTYGGGTECFQSLFDPGDMFSIDTKLDDGNPAYGKIRVQKTAPDCITTNDGSASKYNVMNSARACTPVFMYDGSGGGGDGGGGDGGGDGGVDGGGNSGDSGGDGGDGGGN